MHTIQKQVNNTNHIIPARDALIFFTVILAITIVTRIGHFPASVINWDESLTLLVSRDILNGILPYDGAFEHKPVALYYIFSLSQLLFGESIYAIRILAIIVVSLTGFFLTILMRTVASSGILASVSTGVIYVTFSIQNSGQATLSEIIINFYLVAALLMFNTIKLEKYKHLSVGISFLIGFIFGFAIQTNYLSLVIIIPFFIMNTINIILMVRNKDKHNLNLYLKNSLVVLISLIGTFLILLMPIAIWGDIENYFTKQVNFLLGYKSTINTETYIYRLISSLSKYKELIVLAIAFIIYKMSKVIHRESSITNESDISWQAIIYLIGSLLAAISSGRVYPHYFILLLPSLCILNGLIIEKLSRHNSIRKYLAITISLYIGIISLNTVTKNSAKPLYKYLHGLPADRPIEIANYIRPSITQDDLIYVYDYHHVLYYLLNVSLPTKYPFHSHHLRPMLTNALGFKPETEVAHIMSQNPKFVIAGSNPENNKHGKASKILSDALDLHYKMIKKYGNVRLYERL